MSTLTDARFRKFEELLFSPVEGAPDRASGTGCSNEETTPAPEPAPTETADGGSTPTPDRASGTGCANG